MTNHMINTIFALLFFVELSIQSTEYSSEFTNTFKLCSRSDQSLDQCVVNSLNGAREMLAAGLPTIGLPSLRAFPFKSMKVDQGPTEINLKGDLFNGTWYGLEAYNVTDAKIDFLEPSIEFVTIIPKVIIKGRYRLQGRILTFRLNGVGAFDLELRELNITHRIGLKEEEVNGEKYWKVIKYIFDVEMEYAKVNFENLFNGNKHLGSYSNNMINKNWRVIYEVYGMVAKEAFGNPFKNYANILLRKIPVKDLFLP